MAVGIPREWMPLVRQVSLEKREWVGVQLADTAYFSAHLPPVATVASVVRAEEILDEISVQVQRWRDSRLKAPKWVVLGVDANVRVLAEEEGRTGNVVWSREPQSTLHRRQTMALMTFASAHNLKLANTFAWSYEGCRPPGRRQARPQAWTWARYAHGHRGREAQLDYVLLPSGWDCAGEVWRCRPVRSDHYPVWAMWERANDPWRLREPGWQLTGWVPADDADKKRYQRVVDIRKAKMGTLTMSEPLRE